MLLPPPIVALTAVVLVFPILGCGEVERDATASDDAGASPDAPTPADAPAASQCSGCLALSSGGPKDHPCPGAQAQFDSLMKCFCEACPMCSIPCPDVQGPITDECRDCAKDPPACGELAEACFADTRRYSP